MNEDDVLDRLRKQGFAVLDPLTPDDFRELDGYLRSLPVYLDAHVPATAHNRRDAGINVIPNIPVPRSQSGASECVCIPTSDAIRAPFLFERALALTDIAAAYLGRDPPVCYSANAFWTRPGPASTRPDIQEFHVDTDDDRFLVMFVYLSHVFDDADGPQDLYGPGDVLYTIRGQAGTVFLADTSRLHRGRKPTSGERGIAWFRWGVSDRPPANVWDRVEPIPVADMGGRYPDDLRLRESMRLLVS
jgi:hypothetical protein